MTDKRCLRCFYYALTKQKNNGKVEKVFICRLDKTPETCGKNGNLQ